jgi:hypothetical protein
MVMAGRLHC